MTPLWELRTIDELCHRVTSGGTPSRAHQKYYGGVIPWVKTGELLDREIVDSEEKITAEGLANSSAKLLPPQTVLMAMYGATVGALGRLGCEATCNQASCAMIVDPLVADSRWLYYALLNDRPRIVGRATGAAQQNLSAATIKQFTYRTPPLPEQQAIAKVLGALDDKIAANTALAATADASMRAEYAAFGNARRVRVGDIALSPRKGVDPTTIDPSVVYVGLEHIPRRRMWLDDVGVASDVTSGKSGFERGDILFGKLRPYFHKVAMATVSGICSTDVLVVRADEPANESVLLAAISSDDVIEAVVAASEGTRMPRTSWKDLAATEINWPKEDQISAVAARLDAICAATRAALEENRTLAATRDALLPQLMSGKLRVRDAEAAASAAGA